MDEELAGTLQRGISHSSQSLEGPHFCRMPVWVLVKPARRTLAVRATRTSSGSARPALLIETRGSVAPGLSPRPASHCPPPCRGSGLGAD